MAMRIELTLHLCHFCKNDALNLIKNGVIIDKKGTL